MTPSWLSEAAILDWLIRSTLLIGLAWIAVSIARRLGAPAALGHLFWLMGIFSAAALPLAAALVPFQVAVLPSLFETPAPVAAGGASAPAMSTFAKSIAVVYVLVASALLLRIALGQWRLAAVWRRALSVDSISAEAADMALGLDLRRRAAVRLADRPSAPMTWGVLRPRILLPAAAMGWPPAQRRLVLMHELAHVARADSLTQLLTSLVLALFWFQPALWFAAARLRNEQEHACDDHVLTAGAAPFAYAHTLLNVAAGRHGDPTFASAAAHMAGRAELEGRLNAIVAERRRRALGVASRVLAIGAAVAVLVAAATAAPAPAHVPRAATSPPEDRTPTAATPAPESPAHGELAPAADSPISERDVADAENVRDLQDAPTRRARHAPAPPVPAPPAIAPLPALPAAPPVAATPVSPAAPVAPVARAAPVAPVARAAPVTPMAHPAPVSPVARAAPVAPVSRAAPVAPRSPAAPVAPLSHVAPIPPGPLAPAPAVSPSPVVAPTPPAPPASPTPPARRRTHAPVAAPS